MPKEAKRRSMGGTSATLGRYSKIVRSKELAEERAKEKRKEEGRNIEAYQKVLKSMGMEESDIFKKRKEAYAEKLQAEKDIKHRRQATKRKKREAEVAAKAAEDAAEKGEAAPTTPQDVANPFRKAQQKFDAKRHEAGQEKARRAAEEKARAEELAKANRRRMTTHIKLQQKTKRGQPIMANKMDYLMNKIQKSMGGK